MQVLSCVNALSDSEPWLARLVSVPNKRRLGVWRVGMGGGSNDSNPDDVVLKLVGKGVPIDQLLPPEAALTPLGKTLGVRYGTVRWYARYARFGIVRYGRSVNG